MPDTANMKSIVRVRIKEQNDSRKTKIYNHSERNIFLIPILTTATGDPRKAGQVDDTPEITIPAEDSIEVDFRDYDQNSSRFLTSILFRAADDKIEKVLEDFHSNGSTEEKLYLPHELKKRVLHLQYNEVNIVQAGQIKSMRDLLMDIKAKQEQLKKVVEDLLTKTDDLIVASTGVER